MPSAAGKSDSVELNQISFSEGAVWKGRSSVQKCLVVFLVIFIIIAVIFFISFLVVYLRDDSSKDSSEEHEGNVCTTRECLQAAAAVSSRMNTEINPCQDFYEFACGKWRETHPVPVHKKKIDNFALVDDKNKEILRAALLSSDTNTPPGLEKLKTFFQACVDTETIERRGIQPLADLLQSGGDNLFPTLKSAWTDAGWTFSQIVERVGNIGNLQKVPGFQIQVTADPKDTSKLLIQLDQPQLTLLAPQAYTGARDSFLLTFYETVYAGILILLGADEKAAKQDAAAVVDFEVELAKIMDRPDRKADVTAFYNKTTVQNLTDLYPQFDWLGLFNRYVSGSGVNITTETEVLNVATDYFGKLFSLTDKTPERTLLNYGMWRIAFTYASQSAMVVRNVKEPLMNVLLGISHSPERWRVCVDEMLVYFGDHMGRLFVDYSGFTAQAKQRAESLFESLETAFKEILEETDWMTDATKQTALDKLAAMGEKVAYPDKIMNDTWINERIDDVNITVGLYLENTINTVVYTRLANAKRLKGPADRNRWDGSPATINAFYTPESNDMNLPVGILQPPFFDDAFPDFLNFGAVGSIVGHEITHGHDTIGRGFDKYGNLASWWQTKDAEQYSKKAHCMLDQYSEFADPVLNTKVNGEITLSENIADNGGLKASYKAYRSATAKRGKEEGKLPVLPYSTDQLFFIGFAQMWCANVQDTYRQWLLQTDFHSPHRFRVIGALQNNEDFVRVFNCPTGSYLNPEKKCSLW